MCSIVADVMSSAGQKKDPQRLGVAGLALHYANIINQIDNIVILIPTFPSIAFLYNCHTSVSN